MDHSLGVGRVVGRQRQANLAVREDETAVREGNPNSKEHKEADHIELVSMTIQPGQEIIVGQTLRTVLSAAQKGKPA